MTPEAESSSKLPSVAFAIPLPKPARASANEGLPTFALYTFPRSPYEKPMRDPLTGKRPKEKIVKKFERKWQQEVKQGKDIKSRAIKDAGRWKRFKGLMINTAASILQWMPSNVIATLARLPPIRKLGKLSVYYPHPDDIPPGFNLPELDEEKMNRSFFQLVTTAKSKAKTRTIASGILLPVTLAVDILLIIPLFLFEINLAYFSMQFTGSKKISSFTKAEKKSKADLAAKEARDAVCEFKPGGDTLFSRTLEHVYSICSSIDPIKFPRDHTLPSTTYVADKHISTGLIQIFIETVPAHVAARHILDEDVVGADLDHTLRKVLKEYVRKLR